jgi:hypothetical protein
MTRTAKYLVPYNGSGIINWAATDGVNTPASNTITIDSSLVSAGLQLLNAFNVKTGSTVLDIYNSAVTAKTISIRAGNFMYGSAKNQSYTVSIPASTSMNIKLDQVEPYVKRQDGSIYIDFQTGFTGTLKASGEITALNAGIDATGF